MNINSDVFAIICSFCDINSVFNLMRVNSTYRKYCNINKKTIWSGKEFKLLRFDKMKSLYVTNLSLDKITPYEINIIRQLPIKKLKISNFNPKYIKHLEGLPIEELGLYGWGFTANLSILQHMPLKKLDIYNGHIPYIFYNLPHIEILNISESSINNSIQVFKNSPIRNLNIYRCFNIDNDDLQYFPHVEILNISNTNINENAIPYLLKMPLKSLITSNEKIAHNEDIKHHVGKITLNSWSVSVTHYQT